jgi:hypothetical protein
MAEATPMPSMNATIAWAKSVPLGWWLAQGYRNVGDFAYQVWAKRYRRHKAARPVEPTWRVSVGAALQRLVWAHLWLRREARREAGLHRRHAMPVRVVYDAPLKPERRARYVAVHPAWVLRELRARSDASLSVPALLRRWEPVLPPHWVDRMAAGVLAVPSWLTPEQRERVKERALDIADLRWRRRITQSVTIYARPGARTQRVLAEGPHGLRLVEVLELVPSMVENARWRFRAHYLVVRGGTEYELSRKPNIPETRSDWLRLLAPRRAYERQCALLARRLRKIARRAAYRTRYGEIVGWRWWNMVVMNTGEVVLRSPYRGTVWTGPTLRVPEWTDSDAVRGVAGIHALIRGSDEWVREYENWRAFYIKSKPHPVRWTRVLGRIRGSGRVAIATRDIQGFRCEVATIDLLVVPWYVAPWARDLSERYQCPVWLATRKGSLVRVT